MLEKLSVSERILSVVKEALPEATAGELKKYIEQSEQLKKNFEAANAQLEANSITINDLQLKLQDQDKVDTKLKKAEEREKILDAREVELNRTENNQKVEMFKYQLAEAEKRANVVERLVEKVFGLPTVSVSNYNNRTEHVDYNGRSTGGTDRILETRKTTKE